MDHFLYSNIGNRPVNEDSVGFSINGDKKCYILCDGLGGHGMGDAASRLVVNKIEEYFERVDGDVVNFLGDAFYYAQKELMKKQKELNATAKMKTTCVALVTDDSTAYIGHIGDSRLYIFSHNKVYKRTLDHSIPQMLVLSHEIKEKEIRNHPDRNIVLRVMGIEWDEPKYELMEPIGLNKCDAFLLCSDGFWELIEEKDMLECLKKAQSAEEWINLMAEIVNANGANVNMDNNSAIGIINKKRKGFLLW